jgi:hypothetical protein
MATKPVPVPTAEESLLIGKLDAATWEMRRVGDSVELSLVPTPDGGKES